MESFRFQVQDRFVEQRSSIDVRENRIHVPLLRIDVTQPLVLADGPGALGSENGI